MHQYHLFQEKARSFFDQPTYLYTNIIEIDGGMLMGVQKSSVGHRARSVLNVLKFGMYTIFEAFTVNKKFLDCEVNVLTTINTNKHLG